MANDQAKEDQSASGLVVDGDLCPCAVPVRNWSDHGMLVVPGEGARPRRRRIDLLVGHWTGSERGPERVFKTLRARSLGVEFCIGASGDVWQFADPAITDTFDAGIANRRSAGVEIVSYGFRRKQDDVPTAALAREHEWRRINRERQLFAKFYPAQLASFLALAVALSAAIPTLPLQIPRNAWGKPLARTMSKRELAQFSGILGHFHVSRRKLDPGLHIFEYLDAAL